jgi:hypothetical protein
MRENLRQWREGNKTSRLEDTRKNPAFLSATKNPAGYARFSQGGDGVRASPLRC